MQQYQTLLTHVTVRLEAILTQLILQHALRIRVVAEGTSEAPNSRSPTTATSTAAPSISGSSTISSEHDDTASTSTKANPTTIPSSTSGDADAGKSLVGRMNNLISSDMQAIGQAAEFIQVFLAGPLIIFLTIAFLYTILGWRYILSFTSAARVTDILQCIGWFCGPARADAIPYIIYTVAPRCNQGAGKEE